MTTVTQKDLSRWMSGYMDEIGFDSKRIQERIDLANKCSRAKDLSTKCILKQDEIEKIFVGSFREGIGMNFCNDTDILQINHAVFCCDSQTITKDGKLNFKMEQKRAPAGYTMLKLISTDTDSQTFESLKYAIVDMKRGKYLSSKQFMTKHDDVFQYGDGFISKNTHYKSPKGPSIPKYVKLDWFEKFAMSKLNLTDTGMDYVRAFPCCADEYLEAWKNRDRKCGWPSQQIISNVISMPVYVVPVGKKRSINEDLQWRISFTMAETHLIQAFNNTQTKVFVLLKLIAKHILQPLCNKITSYIMKTVMLWQAETIPQRKFHNKNLLSRLTDTLAFLTTAIENKNLPSYMIPENNLLEDKIKKNEQGLLLKRLKFLQVNGITEVGDFFSGCSIFEDRIQKLSGPLYIANSISKMHMCALHCFTSEDLANYYTTMYTYKSCWQIRCYNVTFIWIPYLLKYRKQEFDPLSIELPLSIVEKDEKKIANKEEKYQKEVVIVQEGKKTAQKSTLLITVEQRESHQDLKEQTKVGHLFMICALLYALIILLLIVHSRVCLRLLLADPDNMVIETEEEQIISNTAGF